MKFTFVVIVSLSLLAHGKLCQFNPTITTINSNSSSNLDGSNNYADDGTQIKQKQTWQHFATKASGEKSLTEQLLFSSNYRLGFIDVTMISAELSHPARTYVATCIANSSAVVDLPLSAEQRRHCTTCTSSLSSLTRYPTWHQSCLNSHQFRFPLQSRVTFELWESFRTSTKRFLGGITLTIQQLLASDDNGKELYLRTAGGPSPANFRFVVT